MAKWKIALVTLAIALLVVPVLITQFTPTEGRDLEGVGLASVEFEEIHFINEAQDLELGGMLLVPEGPGPFPAAVFIHGSGTSQRNNGWYLTVAQHLQENGILVLLPDKRGSENSMGDWRTASFEDLATDTLAAIDYLQAQDQLDIISIGIIGMSQGGTIAPVVATQSESIDFVVNVVGGAVPMYQGLVYEEKHNLREIGLLPGISDLLAYPAAGSLIYLRQTDFWGAVGNFDPLPYWRRVEAETLVLYGVEDSNVPSQRSAALLRSLEKPNMEVIVYEGSGHALESPPGGGDSIFRQDALNRMSEFIHSTAESN